jgi:TM2 domain-containing membrane protein YozV
MTELVDSLPEDQKRAFRARPGPSEAIADEDRQPAALQRAVNAALLSIFFPGCGHVYAGRLSRGVVWSVIFVGLVLPLALFAYVVLGSFDRGALARIAVVVFLLLVACAAGAFRSVPRRGTRAAAPPPSVGVLGFHAAAITFLVAVEVIWFLQTFLGSRTVQTGAFEPTVSAGQEVTAAFSKYVRPVHGDIVLFAGQGNRIILGRVLAKPRDRMELRGGAVLVNNLLLDLRSDQRRDLERAGRQDRRRRLLPGQRAPDADTAEGREFALSGPDWGPFTVPEKSFLVIPDEVMGTPGAPRSAVLIPESSLRGRILGI